MKEKIENGEIESVYFGKLDWGYLTVIVTIKFGSSHQGFGTHDLRYKYYGLDYIEKLLDTFEVDSLDKMVGMNCRAKRTWGNIFEIGHIIEDRWFNPEKDLDKEKEEEEEE